MESNGLKFMGKLESLESEFLQHIRLWRVLQQIGFSSIDNLFPQSQLWLGIGSVQRSMCMKLMLVLLDTSSIKNPAKSDENYEFKANTSLIDSKV